MWVNIRTFKCIHHASLAEILHQLLSSFTYVTQSDIFFYCGKIYTT